MALLGSERGLIWDLEFGAPTQNSGGASRALWEDRAGATKSIHWVETKRRFSSGCYNLGGCNKFFIIL